jgi:transposase
MKFKLKLNSIQKKLINRYYSDYKFSYNKTVGIIKSQNENFKDDFSWLNQGIEQKSSWNTYYSKFDLRNIIVPEHCNPFSQWVLETPFQIRAYGVFEAYDRYKTCISNLKKGNIKFFDLKFKKKRDTGWTFNFPKDNLFQYDNGIGLYATSGVIRTYEKIKINIRKYDCKVQFDGKNYYLLVPYDKSIKETKRNSWCFIDPGVRKFLTCYSPDQERIDFIGDRASSKLYENLLKLDKTIGSFTKTNFKKFKQKKIKLLNRIKNLQQELHRKTSKFLCETYSNIVIPKLTKENDIINTKTCKLKSKTVRNMVVLGHCKFIEMLKTKAKSYKNTEIHSITEEYTSQTCLCCRKRTKTSLETFKCKYKECSFEIDRDILGSINIFWKYFGLL